MSDELYTMDGHPLYLGDQVFDVLFGRGSVVEILTENRFRVAFPHKNQAMTYNTDGIGARYTRRTLYWHDPVVVIPNKGESNWSKVRPILMDVVAALRTV